MRNLPLRVGPPGYGTRWVANSLERELTQAEAKCVGKCPVWRRSATVRTGDPTTALSPRSARKPQSSRRELVFMQQPAKSISSTHGPRSGPRKWDELAERVWSI